MKNEKTVLFFDLEIGGLSATRGSKKNPKPSKLDLNRNFKQVMQDLMLFLSLNKKHTLLPLGSSKYLEIVEVDTIPSSKKTLQHKISHFIILVNMIQGNNSNISTRKIESDTLLDRDTVDLTGKGIEYSTHILIENVKSEKGRYLVKFEKTDNHSFKDTIKYINRLLKQVSKNDKSYSRPHFNGIDNQTMIVYPHLTFLGHPSNQFKKELDNGKMKQLTVCFPSLEIGNLDSSDHDSVKHARLSLNIEKNLTGTGNFGFVQNNAATLAKKLQSDEIRVSFEDETGQARSATLDSSMMLINSDHFVKKHKIHNPNSVFDSAYSKINKFIIHEMIKLK